MTRLVPPGTLPIESARARFAPSTTWLNTATLGLPPAEALARLREELDSWAAGTTDAAAFDVPVAEARASYARLVGVPAADVAVGSQVSAFVGLIAAALPDAGEVLTVEGDFTSVLFPLLAQTGRGVRVRAVPLEELAGAVRATTSLVAVSAVQSADGRVADLESLVEAADAAGSRVLLDVTQAAGWLPVDASRFAYTVCGGYKWLLAPRGTAFLTLQPDLADGLVPHAANWYAGEDRWASCYGAPLRLAADARRFDLSPAWHSWVGQAAALDLLEAVGVQAIHDHDVALANRFRAAVGIPPTRSAIVSLRTERDLSGDLARAGVASSVRAGRLRLSFHLYNTADDADLAAEVVAGAVIA